MTRRSDEGSGIGTESVKKETEDTGLPAIADTQRTPVTEKADTTPPDTEPVDTDANVEVGGKPEEIKMVMPAQRNGGKGIQRQGGDLFSDDERLPGTHGR